MSVFIISSDGYVKLGQNLFLILKNTIFGAKISNLVGKKKFNFFGSNGFFVLLGWKKYVLFSLIIQKWNDIDLWCIYSMSLK